MYNCKRDKNKFNTLEIYSFQRWFKIRRMLNGRNYLKMGENKIMYTKKINKKKLKSTMCSVLPKAYKW